MQEAFRVLKTEGRAQGVADRLMTYAEFSALVELPHFQALDHEFG